MKSGRIRLVSILIALASILGILLLNQARSAIPSSLFIVLFVILFIVGMVSGFSARIYSKPRWYGSGLRDDDENEKEERDRDEPYYHH